MNFSYRIPISRLWAAVEVPEQHHRLVTTTIILLALRRPTATLTSNFITFQCNLLGLCPSSPDKITWPHQILILLFLMAKRVRSILFSHIIKVSWLFAWLMHTCEQRIFQGLKIRRLSVNLTILTMGALKNYFHL